MKLFLNLSVLFWILFSIGCDKSKPSNEVVTDFVEVTVEAQRPAVEPDTTVVEPARPDRPARPELVETKEYVIFDEPWGQYFKSTPYLILLNRPSKGILALLEEEQKLIKLVLDTSSTAEESSGYAQLKEELAELKTVIPSAETVSGYVPGSQRRYSYTYVIGNTIYTRTRPSYYYNDAYYSVFREKQKSSSADLVSSVESLVHNASLDLEDLDQRIEALQHLRSQWSRRTSLMSATGTSGIVREANEAYLESLRTFSQDVINFRKKVRLVEERQEALVKAKATTIANWENFENTRLPVLREYLTQNALEKVQLNQAQKYEIPVVKSGQILIFVCQIGARELYFDLSKGDSEQHPFQMINVETIE